MIHPINSGIILQACWYFYDGKKRGTSLDVLRFLWPKYLRCLEVLRKEGLPDDHAIPRNIHIMICRDLKKQGYWKTV